MTIRTCIPDPHTQSPTGIIGVGGGDFDVVIAVDIDDAVDVAKDGGSGGLENSASKNLWLFLAKLNKHIA